MPLIDPEILAAARGLSAGASGFLVAVGLLLWGAGWRWHRFWIVFGITLGAGIVGLGAGRAAGGQQVLVVGVLLALSAGMLALELAKGLAFATGGVAAWVGVQALVPQAQELWAVFLAGGLVGVLLYRLWTMLTTSLLGTLIAWHAGLALAAELFKLDAARWAAEQSIALTGGVIASTLLGVVVQTKTARESEPGGAEAEAAAEAHEGDAVIPIEPWWKWRFQFGRKAG